MASAAITGRGGSPPKGGSIVPTNTTVSPGAAVPGLVTANVVARKSLFSHVRYEHMVAGVSGGVTSALVLHPLELIKIRFAVSDGRTAVPQYKSLSSAFVTIFRQEGFRGLYKGVTPNVWGSGSAWGFYFMFYNTIKTWIQKGDVHKPLGPTLHMVAAAEAGILTLIMTNPIWVVKTRLCLQINSNDVPKSKQYRGMVDALVKLYKEEGVRGLYRGFVPGIFGVSHGAIQFMTYEEMKNQYNVYREMPYDTKMGTLEYLFFAATSKLIAAAATYPYQLIRARLQDQHHSYEGVMDCIRQTWRNERWVGFYKGLRPNLVRVMPATMITFVTYEHVSHFLLMRSKKQQEMLSVVSQK